MLTNKLYAVGLVSLGLVGVGGMPRVEAADKQLRVAALPCLERAMHILEINKDAIIISAHCQLPQFHHQKIADCYCSIRDVQSLEPLFTLWRQIKELEFIDDPLIASDFIRFVIILCKAQLQAEVIARGDTFEQMFALYDQIASLPIPQLLNLLDDIVNQYETFYHQYELHNQSLTWPDWFKKYWWAPPIIMFSVIITYLRHTSWVAPQG